MKANLEVVVNPVVEVLEEEVQEVEDLLEVVAEVDLLVVDPEDVVRVAVDRPLQEEEEVVEAEDQLEALVGVVDLVVKLINCIENLEVYKLYITLKLFYFFLTNLQLLLWFFILQKFFIVRVLFSL
jgi:hypothetical protein